MKVMPAKSVGILLVEMHAEKWYGSFMYAVIRANITNLIEGILLEFLILVPASSFFQFELSPY
jgi:hypothetical protein